MKRRTLGLLAMAALVVGLLVPGTAVAAPKVTTFLFTMTGDAVVPGPGDADGAANVAISLWFQRPSHLCVGLGGVQGVARPFTAIELHRAPAGETGDVVATLTDNPFGLCTDVDKKVLQDIESNPQLYYLDAHTEEFPDGAIRGQLQ